MDQELKDRWVAALRSGDYSQARNSLRVADIGYCCLDVLADLISPQGWLPPRPHGAQPWQPPDESGDSRIALLPEAMLDAPTQTSLIGLNDSGKTFGEVADYIEEKL